jgi:hypothetical protein
MEPTNISPTAATLASFREDGTYRVPLDLTPGRHRPRDAYRRPKPTENLLEFLQRRELPSEAEWDRGRQLAVMGDPLADDYVALYPKLGYAKARAMLDTALERGIDQVPDAPPALRALFAEVDTVPSWVDWKRVERGAAVMRRYAPLTWVFARLAFAQTYVNANAGMPLYMSGSLGQETAARRLKETDRWRLGIQQPGALRREGDGFKTVVRVRVLHALLRHHLLSSGKWDVARLGMPIPQLDMAGANVGMLLAHSYLLTGLGVFMTPSELEDVIHLWRYHGHLIGVADDLNPKSRKDLRRIDTLIATTIRNGFDERARALTRSTMNTPLREGDGPLGALLDYIDIRASHGLYQLTNGRKVYEMMGLDDDRKWLWFLPGAFAVIFPIDTLRRFLPGGSWLATQIGGRYIDGVMRVDEVKNAPFRPYHMGSSGSRAAAPPPASVRGTRPEVAHQGI